MAASSEPALDSSGGQHAAPWAQVGLAAAGVVLVAFRLHAFELPLETDECNYAYIAGRLLAGDRLYLDVWDHQPFGVFALFAAVIAIFGDAPDVLRWLATFFSLGSLVFLFLILRHTATTGVAVCGAIMFAIASSDPGTAGEGCNREIYMNTLILAAFYLALRRRVNPRWSLFLSGCALAVASSVKTVVAVHWLVLAVWIGLRAFDRARGQAPRGAVLRALAWFTIAPASIWILTFGYFAVTGRSTEFIDAVFLFNLGYSGSAESIWFRLVRFFNPERHPFIFDSASPLWLGGLVATVWLAVEVAVRRSRAALAALLLVVAGYVAVCLPAKFWPHYYYLMIPSLVIALAMALGRLAAFAGRLTPGRGAGAWTIRLAIYALGPVSVMVTEYRDYLGQTPFGITVKRYNSRDFWGRGQGENVRRVTDPGDEIFVFGNDTSIYYYSGRRCASRFTMITGLQSGYPGSNDRRAILLRELAERRPRLILVLFDEPPFPEWKAFLQEHYTEPIGWDYHDRSGEPIMFVVAVKDRPVEPIDWNWDRAAVGGWFVE